MYYTLSNSNIRNRIGLDDENILTADTRSAGDTGRITRKIIITRGPNWLPEENRPMLTVEQAEIETTDIRAWDGDVARSTTTTAGNTVVITGVFQTNELCDDRVAILRDVSITDQVLIADITTEREQQMTLCRDVLGRLEFEARITVSDAAQIERIDVQLIES